MPKTTFINGTILTPEFLNTVFAHLHDGADNDGHVAKINLTDAAEVTGQLPVANQFDHIHDGIQRAKVNPDTHVVGVSFGSFVAALSGFATFENITIYWRKFANAPLSNFPTIVELYIPDVIKSSTDSSMQAAVSTVPADIRPDVVRYASLFVYNIGLMMPGMMKILANGGISFKVGVTTTSPFVDMDGAFSSGNDKGFPAQVVRYIL